MNMTIRWLQCVLSAFEAICASRRSRACLMWVIVLMLATGGAHAPTGARILPVADRVVCALVRARQSIPIVGRKILCVVAIDIAVRPSNHLPLLRGRDLREGGLPAPRAPDAV